MFEETPHCEVALAAGFFFSAGGTKGSTYRRGNSVETVGVASRHAYTRGREAKSREGLRLAIASGTPAH